MRICDAIDTGLRLLAAVPQSTYGRVGELSSYWRDELLLDETSMASDG